MNRFNLVLFKDFIIKLITSAIVLALTAFFTPYFEITAFFSLILAAFVITIVDYIFNILLDKNHSNLVRGIIGFLVSIVILYGVQFVIPSYIISLPSAIVGAIIYSLIASNINLENKKKDL